jgi:hypothetical protein
MSEMSHGPAQSLPKGERRAELERLKAAAWPAEGRDARIARALDAWRQLTPPTFDLDASTWKWFAEDPDLEDA